MNLSIKGILLGTGALVCLLLFGGFMAYQNLRQVRNDIAWVTRSHEVLEALQSAMGALTEAETNERGYLITGNPGFLEAYRASSEQARKGIGRVRQLVRDNPPQGLRAEELERLGAAKLRQLQETIALQDRSASAARSGGQTHLGKSIMDTVRAQAAAMTREERALLAEREGTFRRGYRIAVGFGALSTLLSLALVLALVVQRRRHLRERARFHQGLLRQHLELERLNRALRALSKSNQALMRAAATEESSYLAEICGIVTQDCGHAMVWIGYKTDDPERSVRPAAWAGGEEGRRLTLGVTWADSERGVTGSAIRTGQPCLCRDSLADPAGQPQCAEAQARGFRSALALPLQASGRILGAITFYALEPDAFSPGEVALLKELTADLSQGIAINRLRIEHALAEETLRESEQRFRSAFEQGDIPMTLVTLDGQVLKVNAAFAQMLGYTEAEMGSLNVAELTSPEDRGATLAGFDRLRSGRSARFRMEKRYRHKDGRVIWGDMGTTAVPDAMGRPLYLVTHIQDITERKRAEEGLREANRRKDEFLATLAHELRNPLAPIRTGAYLLSQQPAPDEQTRQILDMITRQAAHMARRVDDLLEVSRIEQGRRDLRKERVDPGVVAAQAVEACRALWEAGALQVALTVADGLPALSADPVRLEQMISNLLNNACKCTPAGGRIEVSAALEGAEVVLRVRDSGVGMTPEVLDHIFELFYQGAQTGDRAGGLGIGLTLVQRLAELHGGSVRASSPGPGQGSEFQLRLPALDPGPPRPGALEPPAAQGGRRHVLVVDDDPSVRTTLEMLLKALDYTVTVAGTGAKGVELAERLRPDIALIDLAMPGMNGLEVATAIRARLGPAMRLVALTGYSRESDLALTRAAGFDQHVVKSGDPRELLRGLVEAR